jgi:hypothetical protein
MEKLRKAIETRMVTAGHKLECSYQGFDIILPIPDDDIEHQLLGKVAEKLEWNGKRLMKQAEENSIAVGSRTNLSCKKRDDSRKLEGTHLLE